MDGALTTEAEARAYAEKIESITGEPQAVFHVLPGTMAWDCGYRFGTCAVSEREAYEAGGANFLDTDCQTPSAPTS